MDRCMKGFGTQQIRRIMKRFDGKLKKMIILISARSNKETL